MSIRDTTGKQNFGRDVDKGVSVTTEEVGVTKRKRSYNIFTLVCYKL